MFMLLMSITRDITLTKEDLKKFKPLSKKVFTWIVKSSATSTNLSYIANLTLYLHSIWFKPNKYINNPLGGSRQIFGAFFFPNRLDW